MSEAVIEQRDLGFTPKGAARVSAVLFAACGGVAALALPLTPDRPGASSVLALAVAIGAVGAAGTIWVFPWERWSLRATLWLVPLAFTFIAGFNTFVREPFLFDLYFLVAFVWLGAIHPPGKSIRFAPLLVAAYLAPAPLYPDSGALVASSLFVIPVCVTVGEAVAWVSYLRMRSERERRRADARFTALVRESSDCIVVCSSDNTITYASPATCRLLGVGVDGLLGTDATTLVHPADRAEFSEAASRYALEFRVICADGSVRWLSGIITDLRNDPDVAGFVVNARDVTDRHLVQEQLAAIAYTDSLTGLPNRTEFLRHLESRLARRDRPVAMLFLDLDGFKNVNDSLGHSIGDCLLAEVATRLLPAAGAAHLARVGGDEFVVVLDDAPSLEEVERVAQRVATALEAPIRVGGRELRVSTSIGVAWSEPGDDASSLYVKADLALYRAKALGKGRYELFNDALAREARQRLDVEEELRQALAEGQLRLRYQPEIELDSGAIVAIEALVRWAHPERGELSPAEFISLAEDTGLINPLGEWVLRTAVAQAAVWYEAVGPEAPIMSVNVSARQLVGEAFVALVLDVLAQHELPARLLRLEVTESVLIETDEATGLLAQLRAAGIGIAIDDLGTGYSSLGYLHRLPIDTLKIDRTFLSEMGGRPGHLPVVAAVVAMGHSLDLVVVAEGVETPDQLKVLRELGCDRVQGYLFGPPAEAARLEQSILRPARGIAALPIS